MTLRKVALLLTATLMLTMSAACSRGVDEEPTSEPTEQSQPSEPTATMEVPTEEPPTEEPATSEPTAYPALPTATPPGAEGGYPGVTPAPTYNPYPGGLVKISHPMGLQCEEPTFADLSAAIASLEEAGIVVVAGEEIGLQVCEACGCATSEHFRVQINVEDLDRALEMGWQR